MTFKIKEKNVYKNRVKSTPDNQSLILFKENSIFLLDKTEKTSMVSTLVSFISSYFNWLVFEVYNETRVKDLIKRKQETGLNVLWSKSDGK